MSKIQKRITASELSDHFKNHPHQELSIILKNKKVLLVNIEKVVNNIFIVKNKMSHRLKIDLQDIHEIWVDERL